MDEHALRRLLSAVREDRASVDDAVAKLKGAPFERLGDEATVDTHRMLRVGMPEVILAEAKTAKQVADIARRIAARGPLLVTRLSAEKAGPVRRAVKGSVYDPVSRTLRRGRMDVPARGPVAVCCAGTSDLPVCEEAVVTLEVMGVEALRVYDVGVAGLHRLLARRAELERARAVIVVAGMEGALPSVVGGLVGRPVIGVPTSVGYGAHMGGLAPLLTMLNSCAPNVTVVNVDNGFGAAFVAGLIARGVTMGALLVLEPVGGIAGDMFLAAAIDLGVDAAAVEAALRTLSLPGWTLQITRRESAGVAGTHVKVVAGGEAPHGRGLAGIVAMIRASGLAPRARDAAVSAFERLGRAEAAVHRVPVERVHFHEVGAVDSIVDLCGAAVVLDLMGWPRVVCAPPELGQGLVGTAHGPMPVPPPAVLELLRGKPVRPGGPPGEAVTPTGATLLAEWAEVGPLPPFVPGRSGYGLGTRDWPDRPNVLRMTLGEELARAGTAEEQGEGLWVLEANLDDCPGELVARAIEAALEAGALDAWAAPLTMKKGRPGLLLGALCDEAHRAAVSEALFAESTTLGVRRYRVEREALEREVVPVETEYGTVRVKLARRLGRVTGIHPEYEDCAARARERGVAVRAVVAAALRGWQGR